MCKKNSIFKLIIVVVTACLQGTKECYSLFLSYLSECVRFPLSLQSPFFIFTADGKFENVKYVSLYVK